MEELRTEHLDTALNNLADKQDIDTLENTYREDEQYVDQATKTRAKAVIKEARIKRLKELMDCLMDRTAVLEKEIKRCSLWVDDDMLTKAKDLLKELRHEKSERQSFLAR